ncbi:DUF6531 domain-containing protein [Actinomycetospora soli]|uniref:DUF6531 domain-containing protein n=1 Tax=Actinomycetospora soli TaxID=2893887 RepID=UPI001E56F720|nr:DUF6531 domain-containing protein [Actinomycetospora soli]MCD2186656.1 DUF6531 domain-containing protein [Actinomycetospora soli]
MPGDAGAVEAGASQLTSTAEQFTSAGEGIRAAGGGLGSAWSGGAATAATGRIAELGTRAAIGADVSRLAGQALTTYATELRSAQEMFAEGERLVAEGRAELATATATMQTVSAGPPSAQRDAAVTGAQGAVDAANAKIAQGEQLQAQAVRREQQANQAATTQVQSAQAQLAGMTAPVPGAAGGAPGGGTAGAPGAPLGAPPQLAAAPPAQAPQEESGFSWGDLGHAALDVVGLVPVVGEVADGANAAWYAAEGDYLNAGLSAAAMVPFAGWAATGIKGGLKAGEAIGGLTRAGEAVAPVVGKDAAAAVRTAEVPAQALPPAGQAARQGGPESPAVPETKAANTEPVDLASGLLFQPELDVDLPGVLPLVLERTHVSNYRAGRFFGPSWASTLDQRLQVGADAVWFARADAHVLEFPTPGVVPVVSTHTPRWTARAEDGVVLLDDLDHGRTLHFTGEGEERWLARITDRVGHEITIERLADGMPVEVRHSGGYRVRVDSALDRIVGLDLLDAGPDGEPSALVRFGYTAGNLTAIVNSSNLPFRYGYDATGRITGWIDRIGTWFRHEYDDQDRVVRQTGADGMLSCDLAHLGSVVEMTDALGYRSHYVHDDARRVVRAVDATGAARRWTWGHGGQVTSTTDPLGRRTTFGYDDAGALVEVVRPDGASVTIERDARGLPVRVVEPDGAVWRHAYDERGLRTGVVDPAGARTSFGYDASGGLASVTDPLGHRTLVRCDAAGLPVEVTDPLGATTRFERDAFGRVVVEVDAVGQRTGYGWTLEGLPASTTSPDGRTARTVYDGERNVVESVDAAGHVTRFERAHFEVPAARVDPDGSRTEFVWDAQVQLVGVRNPQGLTWSYTRDEAGRVVAETDFDGRRRTYRLDAAGQVVERRNALGQTVETAYDLLGQVTEQRAGGVLTTFDHDPAGRLIRATTPEVDLVLERDVCGRVVREAVNGRAVTSSFDPSGRRVRRETPTGQVSTWTFDAASRVSSLHAGVGVAFEHDALGRETRRRAGVVTVDSEWGPQGLGAVSAGPVRRRYRYRDDGYLAAVTGTGARTFDLDALGHVTAVAGEGWSERYAYDAAGNQTSAHWPGDPEPGGRREYRGTLLVRAGRVTYAHDAEGRVVRRTRGRLSGRAESWHYEWDADDRLVGLVTPDGGRWRYVYDALGRRVSKIGPDRQVDFAWDGATLVEEVAHAPDGVASTTWDHAGLHPVCQRERVRRAGQPEIDERFYAIVTDLVGAPTELLALDGSVAGAASRTLWGRTTWTGASTPLLFPGQYHDPESGFAYNVHRHYDPDTARYASLDPLGLAPAPNPSTYVHNPHTWLDPLGLTNCSTGGLAASRPTHVDGQGNVTDGKYTANPTRNANHAHSTRLPGKSYFDEHIDVDRLSVHAAQHADAHDLWAARKPGEPANRARVELPQEIGVDARGNVGAGSRTNAVNVYKRGSGTVHVSPAGSNH